MYPVLLCGPLKLDGIVPSGLYTDSPSKKGCPVMSRPASAAEFAGTAPYRQQLVLGAVLITASELLFATMGAALKLVAAGVPIAMIVFFRSLFGLLPFLPLLLKDNGAGLRPSPGMWPGVMWQTRIMAGRPISPSAMKAWISL